MLSPSGRSDERGEVLIVFSVGDIVDIKANGAVQKG